MDVFLSIWGIDLGVRSLYVARISDGGITHYSHKSLRIHKQSRDHELRLLYAWLADLRANDDESTHAYIEEPPLAGSRNLQTFLHLSQVSGVAAVAAGASTLVPVSSWKKGTVGNGSASKEMVANWLRAGFPRWYGACEGDQNLIDATCIAIYGQRLAIG